MGFVYAYDLSDETVIVKDFIADAAFTTGKRGDIVVLNASGNVVAAGNNPTTVLGVYEGGNFQGLVASGQPYAATTVTQNTLSQNNISKVRVSPTAVYRVPLKAAATAPVIGSKYGCASGTAPAGATAVIDTANTATGAIFEVVAYDAANTNVFVKIANSALVLA